MENSTSDVVDGWIARYNSDRDTGLLELIQLFITSTGSGAEITPGLYANISDGFDEILKVATDDILDEFTTEYPVIKSTGPYRQLRVKIILRIQSKFEIEIVVKKILVYFNSKCSSKIFWKSSLPILLTSAMNQKSYSTNSWLTTLTSFSWKCPNLKFDPFVIPEHFVQ